MNRVFLLTGKPRAGKSTAIRTLIDMIGADKCGGFYTEEIRGASDRLGFRCVTVAGESAELARTDSASPLRVGRYGVMLEPFEQLAVRSIRQSTRQAQVTVIDEIGTMQLLSAPFRELVEQLIADPPHIVLGTIGLDVPVFGRIRSNPAVALYHLDESNRDALPSLLAADLAGRISSSV